MMISDLQQDPRNSHGLEKPRYGRMNDVRRLFGLGRGTVYNLVRQGKIRSCTLRVTQKRTRLRVVDLDSVQEFIEGEMQRSEKAGS